MTAVGAAAVLMPASLFAETPPQRKPRVAALFTELRFRSHAFNILENFFEPYLFRGKLVEPGVEVVSLYADQFPKDDLTRDVSKRFGVPLFDSIDGAMCVGGARLDVDAVLLIGEHGEYPTNALGQREYPRKRFFDEAVATMKRSDRFVPLFNDKHLSYRWDWAKEMYDTARRFQFPLLAGSSVPLAERRPKFELPADAEIEEGLAVHGGGLESYDFHGLEVLQSIVEARRGGETGVVQVELLPEAEALRAADEGRWSKALYDAAMDAEESLLVSRAERPPLGVRPNQIRTADANARRIHHVILVKYADGTRGTVVASGGDSNRWNFACRLKGETQLRATAYFNGPWGNRCLFKALSHAIQRLFTTGREPYPAERTLLTTGILDAAMHSHQAKGKPIATPELAIKYQTPDWSALREDGASWRKITVDTPQPTTFEPGDAKLLQ
ncbi:MAG: hypothetical protein C0483_00695 [Pirellula sp.]|nr:hypothetical protein [Pirellula sp.]